MSDLLHVLPGFSTAPFSHILPSIDKALISTSDLVSLSPQDIAKRALVPPGEVARLSAAVVQALQHDNAAQYGKQNLAFLEDEEPVQTISTLDSALDEALGGGIRPGYVTEITGESGVGKTQFLLALLLAVQLPLPNGLSRSALYISTEAALSTKRLHQLLQAHPSLVTLPEQERPTLDMVLSIQTPDLESQDHIIRYQVPEAIRRHKIGLIVIDSIAANYRAEFERSNQSNTTTVPVKNPSQGATSNERRKGQAMGERKPQLIQTGSLLRNLARKENIAIVVSNQIGDRFANNNGTISFPPPAATPVITPDPLTLDHQQRWFTGWGDLPTYTPGHLKPKTPSLGLVWTNQIAARVALIKENLPAGENLKRRRWIRLVFAAWADPTDGAGIEYDISVDGVKAVLEQAITEDI